MENVSTNTRVTQLLAPNPAQMVEVIDRTERANVDAQVATAHYYPRDITRCLNNAIAIATMDERTAQACGYALPRGGKPITGPSVHLAQIVAQQYGNLRVEARVVEVTATEVVSRGFAWDLENNYATAFDVRRSIVNREGKRFSEDMITVTGNATNAIAYRNAVFKLVPRPIVDKVYEAAQHLITGDLTDEEQIVKRRSGAIQHFADTYGITEEEVVKLCGKHTVNQIRKDEIALLLGIATSLKDGDTTVEELMMPIRQSKEAKNSKLNNIATASAKGSKAKAETAPQAEEAQAVDEATGEVK